MSLDAIAADIGVSRSSASLLAREALAPPEEFVVCADCRERKWEPTTCRRAGAYCRRCQRRHRGEVDPDRPPPDAPRLWRERVARKWSREYVASRLGDRDIVLLTAEERGKQVPSPRRRLAYGELYGLSDAELFPEVPRMTRLERLRLTSDQSLEAVAQHLGVSVSRCSQIESWTGSGDGGPTVGQARLLAEYYGLGLPDVLPDGVVVTPCKCANETCTAETFGGLAERHVNRKPTALARCPFCAREHRRHPYELTNAAKKRGRLICETCWPVWNSYLPRARTAAHGLNPLEPLASETVSAFQRLLEVTQGFERALVQAWQTTWGRRRDGHPRPCAVDAAIAVTHWRGLSDDAVAYLLNCASDAGYALSLDRRAGRLTGEFVRQRRKRTLIFRQGRTASGF